MLQSFCARVHGLIIPVVAVCMALGCGANALAAVGRTAGTFAVTPRGAASYSIPIWAPRGPQGLQPKLALVYNSQSGDGPEGVGWSVAGLSSIYRCNLTVAQDSASASITLTYADRFCMDGNRLRLTSSESLSTYGADGTTYQTEVADFSNVTAHGAMGQGPAYFTVQGRDGLTYEFGHTSDSQIGNGTTAFAWMLDKVTDHAGNTMVVTWRIADANLAGMTVPSSVSWTPSAYGSSTYNYTIQFNYQQIALAVKAGYLASQPIKNYYSLSSVQVLSGGTTIRDYFLGYTLSGTTGRETLTTITECADSAESNCLSPATQLTYQGGQAGVGSSTTLYSSTQAPTVLPVSTYDFNGDGRTDLAWYAGGVWQVAFGTSTGYSAPFSTGITASIAAMGNADGTSVDGFIAPVSGNWEYYKWNGSSFVGTAVTPLTDQTNRFALADVNGDGLPDLITTGTDAFLYVRLNSTAAGGAVSFSAPVKTVQNTFVGISTAAGAGRSLLFYGSGQQDLLATHLNGFSGTILNVLHFNGTTFVQTALNAGAALDMGDYNDDGCTDILQPNTLYLAACNGSVAQSITLPGTAVAALDWDGDGRRDILVANGSTLGVYRSAGNGLSSTIIPTSIPYSSTSTYTVAHSATGDGEDALVVTTGSSPYSIQYYLHNGPGQPPDLLSKVTDGYGNAVSPTYVSTAQGSYTMGTGVKAGYQNFIGPMYVVSNVTFSDPSSAAGGTYSQTYNYALGWTSLQGRGFTAFQRVEHQDSRNGLWRTQGYDYYFPYIGNPVFDNLTVDQAGTQEVKYSFVGEQAITLDGTANNQRYFVYNNMTTQTYQVSWTPGGGSTAGPLIETDQTTYSNWDNYGNPGTITVVRTDHDANSPYNTISWTTTTSLTPYIDDPSYQAAALSAWCPGLIETSQVQFTGGPAGSTAVTRTSGSTANATDLAACRYTSVITEPSSTQYRVTEGFSYDAFGNINTDTVTGINMSPRQTTLAWTATGATTGQFPMSITDPSGATTQLTYNLSFGLPASSTDANGLTTSYQYDGFGRKAQESRPDGTSTTWTYNDCVSWGGCLIGSHTLALAHFIHKTDQSVETDGTTWFDPLERPILANNRLLAAGTYDRNELRYDNLGRVVQQAFPCVYSSVTVTCPYWMTQNYDWLDRLTQSQRPVSATNSSSQTSRTQYQGRTTVVTDANGHATTLTIDVNGWLRKTQDANNYVVTIGYDAAGSRNAVTDNLGNTLFSGSYVYGVGAFMTTSTDADRGGPWSFGYDALGEQTSWTDANGKSFSAAYDALSRMTDRYEPDLYTHWAWGASSASHNWGQLASACTGTGTNPRACTSSGYAESETYDSLARRSTRAIQIPADATYTYTWNYDSTSGHVASLTYPTSTSGYALVVQYGYTNGLLQSIKDVPDNVTLWTANAEDARGQPTQETLGNGVVVNHAFDAVTGWPGSITAGVGGGAALQNNSYLFDEVGNLTQRQDGNQGLTENVYPDVLNRIDHTTLTNPTTTTTNLAMTYDNTGNILTAQIEGAPTNMQNFSTNQAGCATYANAQSKPHALRSITKGTQVTSFCYDANGNVLSESLNGVTAASGFWTSFNQLQSLSGTSSTSSAFSYDASHQRYKQVATFPGGIGETTIYVGGLMEKVTNPSGTAYRHYVPIGSSVAVLNRWVSGPPNSISYLTTDHLGSTTAITDSSGNLVLRENFAAFGWRRGDNWTGKPTSTELQTIDGITHRGFNFQERLDNINLTNFNGRIYGETGEFFSPDPFITDPTNTQDYNRYSYVHNNPLTFVDPSGFMTQCFSIPTTIPGQVTLEDDGLYQVTLDQTIFFQVCTDIPTDAPNPPLSPVAPFSPSQVSAPADIRFPTEQPNQQRKTTCDLLADYQKQQAEDQDKIAKALEAAGLSREATEAVLEQVAHLPAGANVVAVGNASSWTFLNASAAARYGTAFVDPVGTGGTLLTGALRAGAEGGLRVVPIVGYGISGGQIGYELSQGNWDTAAYKTFDAAASAAAVKYGKGWGALGSIVYNLAGGSEALVKNAAYIGLVQGCAAEKGMVIP